MVTNPREDALREPSTSSSRHSRTAFYIGLAFLGAIIVKSLWAATRGIDIEMGDDALYLFRGVELLNEGFPSGQWAPLYVLWFFVLSRLPWLRDNIQIFYWSMLFLSVVTPILLYLFLTRARVLPVVALAFACLYLVSVSNLAVKPMGTRFAVFLLACFLVLSTVIPRRFHPFGLLLTLLLLSFVRPEYSFAFLLAGLGALLLATLKVRSGRVTLERSDIVQAMLLVSVTVLLFVVLGNPLQGTRSGVAIKQHFSINYTDWTSSGADPWVVAEQVSQDVFGDADSVTGMIAANPRMFLRHVLTNARNYPAQLIATGFTPYLSKPVASKFSETVVPVFWSLIIAVALIISATANLKHWQHNRSAMTGTPDKSSWLPRFWYAVLGAPDSDAAHLANLTGLLLLITSAVTISSTLIVYPRPHYFPIQVYLLIALIAIITSNALRHASGRFALRINSVAVVAVVGCVGLVLTPNAAGGWRWPVTPVQDYADQKNTVAAIRELNIETPTGFLAFGTTRYSFNVYLPDNFQRFSSYDKDTSFLNFLRDNQIGLIIWPERLASEIALAEDTEYREFRDNPGSFGYVTVPIARTYHQPNSRLLVAETLLSAEDSVPVRIDPDPIKSADLRDEAAQLVKEGKDAEALALYRRIVKLFPNDRAAHIGLADALGIAGLSDEAMSELDTIIQRWPGYFWAHVQRGEILAANGDMDQAVAAFEQAATLGADDPNLHFTLGHAYRKAGLTDRAITEFEVGLAIDPTRGGARDALEQLKAGQP